MPASNSSLALQTKDIEDPALKRDVEVVCNEVMGIYITRVAKTPPLGAKPVMLCQILNYPVPITITNRKLSDQYDISITCLKTRFYSQIVYQFAHELGHIYLFPHEQERIHINPNYSHWFIESCCIAMSYICLGEMAKKWIECPPFPIWCTYAQEFTKFRQKDIHDALNILNITSEEGVENWIKSHLSRLVKEGKIERPQQKACAMMIEQALLEYPNAWGAICLLGDIIEENTIDFNRWRILAKPKQRELIETITKKFDNFIA